MKSNIIKKSLSIVVLLAVFLLGCMVVRAVVKNVDGGVWDYGVDRSKPFHWKVWSDYHHCERHHHSWCTDGAGHHYPSKVAKPGVWSRSSGGASIHTSTAHYALD